MKTIILLVVLYGCETWSLTLSEEHRVKALKTKVPRIIFGPGGTRRQESGENYIMRSFMICSLHQVFVQ
jgi:hypothetical protein